MLEVPLHVSSSQLISFKLAYRRNLIGICRLINVAFPSLLGECQARSVPEDLSQELRLVRESCKGTKQYLCNQREKNEQSSDFNKTVKDGM